MSGADEWNRAMDALEAADAKRARKAAKREEDARRTAEGRERAKPWRRRPMGLWDWWEQDLRLWSLAKEPVPPAPRWRQRLNLRRSLRMEGHSWLGSDDQWRRLLRPRSLMTRAWRRVKRNQACAALWKELSR